MPEPQSILTWKLSLGLSGKRRIPLASEHHDDDNRAAEGHLQLEVSEWKEKDVEANI